MFAKMPTTKRKLEMALPKLPRGCCNTDPQ